MSGDYRSCTRRGLFIGVSDYADTAIEPLRHAALDAVRFSRALFDLCGFDAQFSKVLTSTSALAAPSIPNQFLDPNKSTLENIHSELSRQRNLGSCEAFVLFFSGHGFRTSGGHDYLVPERAIAGALERTSIPLDMLIADCCAIGGDNTIIVIDACRSRIPGQHLFTESGSPIASSLLRGSRTALLLSAMPGNMSYESDKIESGLFTHCIIELLGANFNCKTLGEIANALTISLPQLSTRIGKPLQTIFSVFIPDDIKTWILPISKIFRPVGLPSWIGEELRGSIPIIGATKPIADLAIDFGTSKTVAAYIHDNEPALVKDAHLRHVTPSTIRFQDSGHYRIGLDHYTGNHSECAKRDLLDRHLRMVENRPLDPQHAITLIVHSVIRNFQETIGTRAERCLIAVPTDFNLVDISKLIECVQSCNFTISSVVREPTAAAFNALDLLLERLHSAGWHEDYDFDDNLTRAASLNALVIDLGGGTLDISIVSLSAQQHRRKSSKASMLAEYEFEVLASTGDRRLGGIDFTNALAELVFERLRSKYSIEISKLSDNVRERIWRSIEAGKVSLSTHKSARFVVEDIYQEDGGRRDISFTVKASDFERRTQDIFDRIIDSLDQCLRQASIWNADFDEPDVVIVAGQAVKMRPLMQFLRSEFPNSEIIDKYADCAVARGLAIRSKSPCRISDVAYYSVGLRGVLREENSLVIRRGASPEVPVWVIYPDDRVPTRKSMALRKFGAHAASITVVTMAAQGRIDEVSRIIVDLGKIHDNASLSLICDASHTFVLEIDDSNGFTLAWQLNNFHRFPAEYHSAERLTEESTLSSGNLVHARTVRRNR